MRGGRSDQYPNGDSHEQNVNISGTERDMTGSVAFKGKSQETNVLTQSSPSLTSSAVALHWEI